MEIIDENSAVKILNQKKDKGQGVGKCYPSCQFGLITVYDMIVYTSRTISSVILLTDSGNPFGIGFKFVTRHGMFLEWWYEVNKSQKQNTKFFHTLKSGVKKIKSLYDLN